jgi:hypothetical protein
MIKAIINTIPALGLLLLAIITAAVLVLTVLALKHHYFPVLKQREHNDSTVVLIRVLSAVYAILIALTIVTQVNAFNMTDKVLTQEANAYAGVVHLAEQLSAVGGDAVTEALNGYINLMLTKDWDAMRYSYKPIKAIDPAIDDVYAAIANVKPSNGMEQMLTASMLNQFNFALDARAQRWSTVGDTSPSLVKVVIFFNLLTLMFMTCMLGSVRTRAQQVFVILTNAVTFSCFVLVFILDFPFSGSMALKPEAFTLMYHIIS